LLGQGVGVVPADCIANRTVRDPTFAPLLAATVADPNATPDPSQVAAVRQREAQITVDCSAVR
jgi:hypothetical protein